MSKQKADCITWHESAVTRTDREALKGHCCERTECPSGNVSV